MTWLKIIGGIILILLGLLWIGQGTNLLPGSVMSGQVMWIVIGAIVGVLGAWLVWSGASGRRSHVSET